MDAGASRETLQIKKYPNRRYYDATRSCHVTLKEMHDLIQSGYDVIVIDSRTGDDITNVVLLQVMLEKDHPKLDLFPSSILHFMIRTNPQVLRAYFEQVFGPLMDMMSASGKQFDAYLREIMRTEVASGGSTSENEPADTIDGETAAELRSQLAELSRRIENLMEDRSSKPSESV